MAIMFPKNISEYMPTDSERFVYEELRKQLPDTYMVFYSVEWSKEINGHRESSEADFIITNPNYGFICLEVKGGSRIYIEDNEWFVEDSIYGARKLKRSPYKQAEESMYYFRDLYYKSAHIGYNGIYAAGVVFPFFNIENLSTQLSNRENECTIDASKMANLTKAIHNIFKLRAGNHYGTNLYSPSEHKALLELIRKRIAISAAAGYLVKYISNQMDVINRVQDNYIYFLSNYHQFYIRGGAGTGKTWIAMKMAKNDSLSGKKVLFICKSKYLAEMVRNKLPVDVEVKDLNSMIMQIVTNTSIINYETYEGLSNFIKDDIEKYDAIYVDEAQDFNEELAFIIRGLLRDENKSKLGVFYDDVQKIRKDCFGDAFMIDSKPFLLRENIRNTSNIYSYAMDNTELGQDVIRNPVEGPNPMKENIRDRKHLTQRLENLLKEYIIDEHLSTASIVILFEDMKQAKFYIDNEIAQWSFITDRKPENNKEIYVCSAFDYKGLEADMVIYVRSKEASRNINYIAYTRAKYYLHELIINEG
ncbi:MAG: NERD domain-containing protein [Alphaproteobacteria bacterium]|nr:NERD domain-containing protein [Alphaproteobacteria bacterium]